MEEKFTIKLYVNQKIVAQKKVRIFEVFKVVEYWKKIYALGHHDYEIYLYVPSKLNN